MYCKYCGKELPNDSNFCPNCGKEHNEWSDSRPIARITKLVIKHKIFFYIYAGWILLHITLFLFSTRKGYVSNPRSIRYEMVDISDDFYPFNMSIGEILNGKSYIFSFNINVYDSSELFFYTIIFPLFLYLLYKLLLNGLTFIRKTAPVIFHRKKNNFQSRQLINYKSGDNTIEITKENSPKGVFHGWEAKDQETSRDEHSLKNAEQVDEIISPPIIDVASKDSKTTENMEENTSIPIQDESPLLDPSTDKIISSENKDKKFPLSLRLVGSIIDKIELVIIFAVVFFIISPYGASGKLGLYTGLLNTSPNTYEFIDRAQMNSYGTYHEGVSKAYQDLERLKTEPPHIGSTKELDMNVTYSFILLNLIYYILFESLLSASPGKRLFRGVLLDCYDEKIEFSKALLRGFYGGILMVGIYYLFHFLIGLSNIIVIIIFFLMLDLPVFFTNKSLLDIITGTYYAKS